MRTLPRSIVLLTGLFAMALAGCNNGGAATGAAQIRCSDGGSFCLVSCDLGCGVGGCAVSEVAENQRLQFVFNQEVAQESITGVSLRTATGEAPAGEVRVVGKTITFIPSISVTAGISSFGFRRNEAYIVTIVGQSIRGVRSVSGDLLSRSISCTITATRGIIDEDNAPPRGILAAPTNIAAAPVGSTIVVRFSEIVDTTPFLTPVSPSTPIHFVLRQTRIPQGSTQRVCNIDSEALQIDGVPTIGVEQVNGRPVTTISLRPTITLPGLACIEVQITADVRDLAGRSAEEATYRFLTEASAVVDQPIVEDFASNARQDGDVSGGDWLAGARGAFVGGDGRHGSFNHLNGVSQAGNTYVWSTNGITIPGSQTFSGVDVVVPDGDFFFTDMVVPAGVTVRFTGTNPAQVHVRGRVDIRGRIEANGTAITTFNCRNANAGLGNFDVAGQPGTGGGPGGAGGGKGGDRCLGVINPPLPGYNGSSGADLIVPGGHAYASQAVGTGGRGSPLFPSHGLNASLTGTYTISSLYNASVNMGGGGGGYSAAGGPGAFVPIVPPPLNQGPLFTPTVQPAGGIALSLLPLPVPAPSSRTHFLIGGSGGGGGGSHPFLGANIAVAQFTNDIWKAGGGGTGGGGAVMIRAGRNLSLLGAGAIHAKGGAGTVIDADNPATSTNPDPSNQAGSFGICAPGGGGSGGSVLLQAHGDVVLEGAIDTSGGVGSRTGLNISPANTVVDIRGGNGSPGFYRLEARGNVQVSSSTNVPAFDVAVHRGTLNDRDAVSGSRSLWRNTGFVFPPTWLRYELQVDSDGDGTVDRLYSDDPSVPGSVGAANDPLGPVLVRFQGARVGATGEPDPGTIRPWRDSVTDSGGIGINGDAATGFRFEMLFNNSLFPDAVVRRLTVFVRG